MRQRRLVAGLSTLAILTAATGCAGVDPTSSAPAPAASIPSSDLRGTWSGSAGWVGANQYEGESSVIVQIGDDGRFTASVTPNRGTNNYAHASALSGTVVTHGNRVTLQNTQGPWTSITLVRSGNTLYGVAVDPAFEAPVMLQLDR